MADKLIRINEAAEITGLSVHTLRKWTKLGLVPFVTINERGDRRFKADELAKWISEQK